MGLFARVLGVFGLQPKAAVGYKSVKVAFRDGRAPNPGSGDYHERYDRTHLYGMSREFFRDRSPYRNAIERLAESVIGPGFGLQARTSKPEWNAEAERIWKAFWRRPEVRGNLSGRGVELAIAKELFLNGDVGIVKTNLGTIQIVEAERIIGPNLSDDGIVRNEIGTPIGYYVAPYSGSGAPQPSKAVKVTPENFLHVAYLERPSSSRGLPIGQSSFSILQSISELCESEVQSSLLQSRLSVAITRQGGPTIAFNESAEDTTKTAADGDVTQRVEILDGVTIFHGEPGDEIKGIDRTAPGAGFTEGLATFFRLLGLAFGLPIEFMLLDWTKTNYSQSRSIIEQLTITVRKWQLMIEDFIHRPLYEWVISRAMESGELALNDEWEKHEWIKPASPWIDQLKEAEANGLMLDRGFNTHANVCKSRNEDRDEVVAELIKETEDAIAVASDIEKRTGVKVAWEPFAGKKAPDVVAPPRPAPGAGARPEEDQAPAEDSQEGRGKAHPMFAKSPVRMVTEVVEKDAHGHASRVVQTYEYAPEVEVRHRAEQPKMENLT